MDRNEYKARYGATKKHIDSFINYAMKQPSVVDWYAYYTTTDGVMIPRGVVVACDNSTLDRLIKHSKRYYPDLIITGMTYGAYVAHTSKEVICNE